MPSQTDLEKMKSRCWIGVFIFGVALFLVPDWHDSRTITGGVIGLILFILVATYSYHVQWRKRLTKKQIRRGWRQHRILRGPLFWSLVGLGFAGASFVNSNNFGPYTKGTLTVFTFLLSIGAVVNIYARKGFFQTSARRK